jgi:Spy/CpxP family protein refolding chaperone
MMKLTLKPLFAATFLTAGILGLAFVNVAIAESNFGPRDAQHCIKAEMKGHRPMDMETAPEPYFLKGIQLTGEQEDKVFALTHAEVPKMRARIKAQRDLRQDLMILIQSNKFDENKARKIADQLANIEKENALAKAHLDNNIMKLLSPEQLEQVIQNKREIKPGQVRAKPSVFHQTNSNFKSTLI